MSRGADAALTSRGEDAPGVAQLREELASLRGDVDHIRSAMQDMHREVGSAVLLLSRFVGLEWDTGEAVRLAEKRSTSASDAVERLSDDVDNLEHRLAVAGSSRPENARGGDGGGGSDSGETTEMVGDGLDGTAPSTTRRQDGGATAGGGGGEGQSLPSNLPRCSRDPDPPHPLSDIQGALPRHRNDDGSKGGLLAPATMTDDHVKGVAAEGESPESHHSEDEPRCVGTEGSPSLSPDGEEGTLLSRRPSAGGGVGGPTLPAMKRSQEGTTMTAVSTAAAVVATVAVVAPQRPDPLGGDALAPSNRALSQGESSTRLRLPREEPLPVLGVADADAGRPVLMGLDFTEAKEHNQDKEKHADGKEEEVDQREKKSREEADVEEEEEEEEKNVKEEDEEDENDDDDEKEEGREKEGVAHATKGANRESRPTSLDRTDGLFSDKHGDTQRAGARRPLVAKASLEESDSNSSGSRRRGEVDGRGESDLSTGGRKSSGSRSMPLDERGTAADHTKHRASDEERSTAGDSTATPPASPPASPPVVSVRSNSDGGGGGSGGGGGEGGGGRNDDDTSSQMSGSWTSRSSDSQSSEQSATSTAPSSRRRGAPDRQVAERDRSSRAAAMVAAAEAAAGAKAAVVKSVPNGDNDEGVAESDQASITQGGGVVKTG